MCNPHTYFNFYICITWLCCMLLLVETLCGSPRIIESTKQVWNGNSTPGSTVLYLCKEGFYNKGENNISTCNENGQWTPLALLCQGNSHTVHQIAFFLTVKGRKPFGVTYSGWLVCVCPHSTDKRPDKRCHHKLKLLLKCWDFIIIKLVLYVLFCRQYCAKVLVLLDLFFSKAIVSISIYLCVSKRKPWETSHQIWSVL